MIDKEFVKEHKEIPEDYWVINCPHCFLVKGKKNTNSFKFFSNRAKKFHKGKLFLKCNKCRRVWEVDLKGMIKKEISHTQSKEKNGK